MLSSFRLYYLGICQILHAYGCTSVRSCAPSLVYITYSCLPKPLVMRWNWFSFYLWHCDRRHVQIVELYWVLRRYFDQNVATVHFLIRPLFSLVWVVSIATTISELAAEEGFGPTIGITNSIRPFISDPSFHTIHSGKLPYPVCHSRTTPPGSELSTGRGVMGVPRA